MVKDPTASESCDARLAPGAFRPAHPVPRLCEAREVDGDRLDRERCASGQGEDVAVAADQDRGLPGGGEVEDLLVVTVAASSYGADSDAMSTLEGASRRECVLTGSVSARCYAARARPP